MKQELADYINEYHEKQKAEQRAERAAEAAADSAAEAAAVNTLGDFSVGGNVNVEHKPNDLFEHDFTGHVKSIDYTNGYIVVVDQDGDVWSCDPDQVSHSSNDIMHETA